MGALTAVLGFMSPDGEVNLTYNHTLNQNYCSEWYHVDTNLDGKFDARDGFGGQYDFYVLTSGFSYSCGNAMPFFAQVDGLAKIIGEQPGGCDCSVAPFLDAYGHVARMSGYNEYKMSPTSISGGGKLLTGGELISPASLKRQEEVLPTAKLEQRRCLGKCTMGTISILRLMEYTIPSAC